MKIKKKACTTNLNQTVLLQNGLKSNSHQPIEKSTLNSQIQNQKGQQDQKCSEEAQELWRIDSMENSPRKSCSQKSDRNLRIDDENSSGTNVISLRSHSQQTKRNHIQNLMKKNAPKEDDSHSSSDQDKRMYKNGNLNENQYNFDDKNSLNSFSQTQRLKNCMMRAKNGACNEQIISNSLTGNSTGNKNRKDKLTEKQPMIEQSFDFDDFLTNINQQDFDNQYSNIEQQNENRFKQNSIDNTPTQQKYSNKNQPNNKRRYSLDKDSHQNQLNKRQKTESNYKSISNAQNNYNNTNKVDQELKQKQNYLLYYQKEIIPKQQNDSDDLIQIDQIDTSQENIDLNDESNQKRERDDRLGDQIIEFSQKSDDDSNEDQHDEGSQSQTSDNQSIEDENVESQQQNDDALNEEEVKNDQTQNQIGVNIQNQEIQQLNIKYIVNYSIIQPNPEQKEIELLEKINDMTQIDNLIENCKEKDLKDKCQQIKTKIKEIIENLINEIIDQNKSFEGYMTENEQLKKLDFLPEVYKNTKQKVNKDIEEAIKNFNEQLDKFNGNQEIQKNKNYSIFCNSYKACFYWLLLLFKQKEKQNDIHEILSYIKSYQLQDQKEKLNKKKSKLSDIEKKLFEEIIISLIDVLVKTFQKSRNQISSAGSRTNNKQLIEDMDKKITDLEQVNKIQEKQISDLKIKINKKLIKNKEQKNLITQQEDQITQQKNLITQQEDQITQQKNQITQQEDQITQQKNQITQQEDQITDQKNKITQLQNQITDINALLLKQFLTDNTKQVHKNNE